jgi:hypothetical protein
MFETEDIYLGAALQEAGFVLKSVVRGGTRARFSFEENTRLRDVIGEYYSGRQLVPAHSYAERIRSAKSMAINAPARDGER